ncbi:hypothetical protein TD95_002365 [Thielaviopsis punctulata]|uniref:F-box domain-containing protein n=1 Tax=Thielaviopsis punctulata TaxID=72032 RepID=A0A0F4ZCX6_9PEZI|nr:hypothetical protein TD95_002365 [Thielaviopsis punctulata]
MDVGRTLVISETPANDFDNEHLVPQTVNNIQKLPNEILILVMSHLDAESQAAIVLVSRRFSSLMSADYAWRLSFSRFFPGRQAYHLRPSTRDTETNSRAIVANFSRLTALATWRTEYMLRTRLLRNLMRGRPGGGAHSIGSSSRSRGSNKKSNAVLTFNTKLPWLITHLHAVFENGKKQPQSIHGAGHLGVASTGDPSTGKIEKWGVDDNFMFAQISEVFANLVPFGLGEDYAACPNVMDVSEPYGFIAGEGYPGGRPFFRSRIEYRARYLVTGIEEGQAFPADLPRVPHVNEGISSIWITKSPDILTATESMIGMMAGSTLGVVTAYSVGGDSPSTGFRFSRGDMTARWAICPGIPIIGLKVDENYSKRRKAVGRVWAVALNALGELYYLKSGPMPIIDRAKYQDVANSWYSGLSVKWHLVKETQRVPRPPRVGEQPTVPEQTPPPNLDIGAPEDERVQAARKIEAFLSRKPSYYRHAFMGWDMQRRLEVDFGNEDGNRRGEIAMVIDRGLGPDQQTPAVTRFIRGSANGVHIPIDIAASPEREAPGEDVWVKSEFVVKDIQKTKITTSAIDLSRFATTTFGEDANTCVNSAAPGYPFGFEPQSLREIPGHRGRFIGVGTNLGKVVVWDMREPKPGPILPVRIIHTDSPEITSLALSSLYLVHGGSDGVVQAWDPLASVMEPLRTINSRVSGRVPRQMTTLNPTLPTEEYFHAGAIFLDPDSTVLRGLVSFGSMVRFWTYSSPNKISRHKRRRVGGGDLHGRPLTRWGHGISGYIAAEAAEIRHEEQRQSKAETHLRKRFGVGAFGDLTEDEALMYAQMMSQESFADEEQRRTATATASVSASESATASGSDAVSSAERSNGSAGRAVVCKSGASMAAAENGDEDFELQMQRALRLSLMEADGGLDGSAAAGLGGSAAEGLGGCATTSEVGISISGANKSTAARFEALSDAMQDHSPLNPPPKNSYSAPITFKANKKRGKRKSSLSGWDVGYDEAEADAMVQEIADLELALKLSMQENGRTEEWPTLEVKGKGKGRAI